MSDPLPIIIIGAGVSGLTLAQGLLKAGIRFRLYERDVALNLRAQGYRLRISGPGIDALRQNLDLATFQTLTECCPEVKGSHPSPSSLLDALSGEQVAAARVNGFPSKMPMQTSDGEPPINADRSVLRSILCLGLEQYIEFGKEFTGYDTTAETVNVTFRDGTMVKGSVLVGADGTWSKIRRQLLPGHQLFDTGGRMAFGKTDLTADLFEHFPRSVLERGGLTLIHERSDGPDNPGRINFLLEPMHFNRADPPVPLPDDYIYWGMFLNHDTPDTELVDTDDSTAAGDLARKVTSHWHPSLLPLFTEKAMAQTSVIRIVTAQPEIPAWDPHSRITLIGDAIHAMAPTAAAGATTALQDAKVLAQMLQDNAVEPEALRMYEQEMRVYAEKTIRSTLPAGKFMFGMKEFEKLKAVDRKDQAGS